MIGRSIRRARAETAIRLAAASLLAMLAMAGPDPSPATAGTYELRNCLGSGVAHMDGRFERYGDGRVDVVETCRSKRGGNVGIQQKRHGGVIPAGYGGGYRWTAPSGADFVGSRIEGRLRNANGIAAQIYATNPDGGYLRLDAGKPHDGEHRQMDAEFKGSPRSQFVLRLACLTRPPCSNRPRDRRAFFQIYRLALELRDELPPSVSAGGELLAADEPLRGSAGYSVTASDTGGGVWKLHAEVNGHEIPVAALDCAGDLGAYADRARPCPSSASSSGDLETDRPPFRQGGNSIRFCARDYANGHPGSPAGPNTACTGARTVTVDNEAPPRPAGIRTIGGEEWRAENDFSVRWEAPSGQATPIVAATYRLLEDGSPVTPPRAVNDEGLTGIDSISAPSPGRYEVEVRLIDAAGNAGPAATTSIAFDDRPPSSVAPVPPDGWLSAGDLPYSLQLERAEPGGPSGVAGYAIRVSRSASDRPCPAGACDAEEITVAEGPDDATVAIEELDEGRSWLSAVAVSGAGVASAHTPPVPVDVDLSDPVTVAEGIPASWSTEPVTITIRADDRGSGMEPGRGPAGPEPVTAVSVDGGEPSFRTGDRIEVTISTDGSHRVRHWARDLAGNESSGARLANGHRHDPPGTETVRVDASPPSLRFPGRLDPDRPELVVAEATDPHSGLASGSIGIRPAGSEERFTPLDTELEAGSIKGRIPSSSLSEGAYELRATAEDRAGNEAATTLREDGSAMVVRVPVKPVPDLRVAWHGRPRETIAPRAFGRQAVEGRLRDAEGRPLAGEAVEVIERFGRGARWPARTSSVVTDRTGRFRARITGGPSRAVIARYHGSEDAARAISNRLRMLARGRAVLGIAPQIARNSQPVRMRGAVRSRGARVPAAGKLVAIQYLDPARGRWRPVEVIRTDRRGRFAYTYRFRTVVIPQRFVFRAISLSEAGWPYLPAASIPRPVVVYPR